MLATIIAFLAAPFAYRPTDTAKSPEALRREHLIRALRNKYEWPRGFVWKWGDCDGCAMGLLRRLYPDSALWPLTKYAAPFLGISERMARSVFMRRYDGDIPSPGSIADKLERLHKSMERAEKF